MPRKTEPTGPIDAYKAIIDELVEETSQHGAAAQVVEKSIFSKAPAHGEFNDFIAALSPKQRNLLAKMLQEEREGAIHDVLAMLSWWITCREMGFTFRGDPMPVDL